MSIPQHSIYDRDTKEGNSGQPQQSVPTLRLSVMAMVPTLRLSVIAMVPTLILSVMAMVENLRYEIMYTSILRDHSLVRNAHLSSYTETYHAVQSREVTTWMP